MIAPLIRSSAERSYLSASDCPPHQVLGRALLNSPHRSSNPELADFYYLPLPFHWGGRSNVHLIATADENADGH